MINPNIHEVVEEMNINELFELKEKINKLIYYELIGKGVLK